MDAASTCLLLATLTIAWLGREIEAPPDRISRKGLQTALTTRSRSKGVFSSPRRNENPSLLSSPCFLFFPHHTRALSFEFDTRLPLFVSLVATHRYDGPGSTNKAEGVKHRWIISLAN